MRNLVEHGDLIYLPSSETFEDLGLCALVNEQMENVSFSYHVLRFEFRKKFSHDFKKYFTNNYTILNHFSRNGTGSIRKTLNRNDFRNTIVIIPPLEEQTSIAKFLDDKTAKIEQACTQKEKQITLLKERRQILIHQAVTKGINLNVKLKDSNVEWIGEIPEDWEVSKLGYYIDILSGYAFKSTKFSSTEVKLLRGINVGLNEIKWDETVYYPETSNENLDMYFLEEGDLVFGMDRPLISGGIRIATIKEHDIPCMLLQRVTRIKAINGLTQNYLKLIVLSENFKNYLIPILSGVSVPHISPAQIKNFSICLPDEVEQEIILEHVNEICLKIDSAISLKEQEIEKLKEYKASLINSAVTGKVRVC